MIELKPVPDLWDEKEISKLERLAIEKRKVMLLPLAAKEGPLAAPPRSDKEAGEVVTVERDVPTVFTVDPEADVSSALVVPVVGKNQFEEKFDPSIYKDPLPKFATYTLEIVFATVPDAGAATTAVPPFEVV